MTNSEPNRAQPSKRGRLVLLAIVLAVLAATGVAPAGAATRSGPASGSTPGATVQGASAAIRPKAETGEVTPCFVTFSDCTSSDPTVTLGFVSSGDTSACTFQETVDWGDQHSDAQTFSGGADGSPLGTPMSHTYAGPGTYPVSITGTTTAGGCTPAGGTATFTLAQAVPLTVSAGPDRTVTGVLAVQLAGQVSDPSATTSWAQVSGPDATATSGPGIANFASTAPNTLVTVNEPGTYVFELTATVGGQTESDVVTVTVLRYVALGDSYSAGDGSVPDSGYLPGTGPSGTNCRRSPVAYPALVDEGLQVRTSAFPGEDTAAFTFVACTGAEIPDYWLSQARAVAPQRTGLTGPAGTVGLVTLSLGGNDLGFSEIMRNCVLRVRGGCRADNEVAANLRLAYFPAELQLLYQGDQAFGLRGLAGSPSLAANARVLVLGYPRFFPASPPASCGTGLGTSFSRADMLWINSLISRADALTAAAN